jgi:hypothetical protein
MPTFRAFCVALLFAALAAAASCAGRGLVRQYEYEEEVYLELDGSATVVVNASVPALIALRGLPLDPRPTARFDRGATRALYESAVTRVTRVSRPWRRAGRRFVQVRTETDDIRQLSRARAFSWSSYRLQPEKGLVLYEQRVGLPAGSPPAGVNWTGDEMIAFRLHLPSRIEYHNAPSHEVERGNILSYEQRLGDRLAGAPVEIAVRMEPGSILRRTLVVFALAVGAAMFMMAVLVWWVQRKGRQHPAGAQGDAPR